MASLLTIPREIRDEIFELVLCARHPPNPHKAATAIREDFPSRWNSIQLLRPYPAPAEATLRLLLINRQLSDEVKQLLDRNPAACRLDCAFICYKDLWPTWRFMPPRMQAPIEVLDIDIIFCAHSPDFKLQDPHNDMKLQGLRAAELMSEFLLIFTCFGVDFDDPEFPPLGRLAQEYKGRPFPWPKARFPIQTVRFKFATTPIKGSQIVSNSQLPARMVYRNGMFSSPCRDNNLELYYCNDPAVNSLIVGFLDRFTDRWFDMLDMPIPGSPVHRLLRERVDRFECIVDGQREAMVERK